MTLLPSPSTLAPAFFADDLGSRGDAPALFGAGGVTSYADLERAVARVTAQLGTARRLVLVEAVNQVESVITYLAALRGRHPVLLVPANAPPAVDKLVRAYDPDVVVSAAADWALDERRAGTTHQLHPDLALLLSTSGSTGSAKVVRLSRENLAANAAAIADYLGLTPDDRAITSLPMHYCYGLSVFHSHLHAGASLVLSELSVVDRCFWDLFGSVGATSFAGVPHTFELLDRIGFDSMSLPSLRSVTQAGGKMAPERVRRYANLAERSGWQLFVMYGQTEATARMAYVPPHLVASHPQTVGVPIAGGSFGIDSPDGDGVGELVYRGPNVMLGYAERREDLALGRTVDVLHTGDLARFTSAGLYEIVGRRGRFVKPFGVRISLDEVEALLADAGVTAACTSDGERLTVCVEAPARVDASAALIRDWLGLPAGAVTVRSVRELPRLAGGKPDYQVLRATVAGTDPSGDAVTDAGRAEVDDVPAAVRALFVDIVGVEPDDDDSFVTLGGDSLSYIEMSFALEEVLGALPRDWHVLPFSALTEATPRPRRLARVDTTVVARAVAIVLIVGTHTQLWDLPGGAHILLAVSGFNFARFQRRTSTVLASVARVVLPSVAWIGAVAALSPDWCWPNALLVNGWLGHPSDKWGYWYIEALVQILVGLALLMVVPGVRRAMERAPFAVALGAVAVGLIVRFDVGIEVVTTRTPTRPHEILWVFALGWATAHADSLWRRLVVSALAAVALPGFFGGEPLRELTIFAGIMLVLWMPTVALPRSVARILGWLAAASLYIYLTHFQVYRPVTESLGPAAGFVVALSVGLAAWLVVRRVMASGEKLLRRALPRRRTHVRVPSADGSDGGSRHESRLALGVRAQSRPGRSGGPRRRRPAGHRRGG